MDFTFSLGELITMLIALGAVIPLAFKLGRVIERVDKHDKSIGRGLRGAAPRAKGKR